MVAWLKTWRAAFVGLFLVGGWWAVHVLPPASYWFSVRQVAIFDAPVGAAVVMEVDRTIARPFTAEWRILVRRLDGDQWEVVCAARGGGDYRPDAKLPSPLTLDWWTEGQCGQPPEGSIMVSTVWTINTAFPGVRTVVAESNVFRVGEISQ